VGIRCHAGERPKMPRLWEAMDAIARCREFSGVLSSMPEGAEKLREENSLAPPNFTRRLWRPLSAPQSDAENQNFLAKKLRRSRSESPRPIRLVDPPNARRLPAPRGSLQALHVKLRGPCLSHTAIVLRCFLSSSHLVSKALIEQRQSGSASSVANALSTWLAF
jgi:hypothetical protein